MTTTTTGFSSPAPVLMPATRARTVTPGCLAGLILISITVPTGTLTATSHEAHFGLMPGSPPPFGNVRPINPQSNPREVRLGVASCRAYGACPWICGSAVSAARTVDCQIEGCGGSL